MRTWRRLAAAVAVSAAAVAAVPAPAAAQPEEGRSVTVERLRSLADRAQSDPAALGRLRSVGRVAGEPVDVRLLLAGAEGSELDARLSALAGGVSAGRDADARAARASAESILSQDRFQPPDVPRPFRGVLEAIGRPLTEAGDALAGAFPGGAVWLWVALAAAALSLAAFATSRSVRRRVAAGATAADAVAAGTRDDPVALERAAEAAERRGQTAEALRLRFRAGLLRLHSNGAIRLRPSMPTGEVARSLRSPAFDRLAADFDAVAYGGRRPEESDLEATRRRWSEVIREAAG